MSDRKVWTVTWQWSPSLRCLRAPSAGGRGGSAAPVTGPAPSPAGPDLWAGPRAPAASRGRQSLTWRRRGRRGRGGRGGAWWGWSAGGGTAPQIQVAILTILRTWSWTGRRISVIVERLTTRRTLRGWAGPFPRQTQQDHQQLNWCQQYNNLHFYHFQSKINVEYLKICCSCIICRSVERN